MALPRGEFWGIRLSADPQGLQGVVILERTHVWVGAAREGWVPFRRLLRPLVAAPHLWGRRPIQQVWIVHGVSVRRYSLREYRAEAAPRRPTAMPFLEDGGAHAALLVALRRRNVPWTVARRILELRGGPPGAEWLPMEAPPLR